MTKDTRIERALEELRHVAVAHEVSAGAAFGINAAIRILSEPEPSAEKPSMDALVDDGWRIVGMNHYRQDGELHLFCSMARDGRAITAEAPVAQQEEVWASLVNQAEAEPEPSAWPETGEGVGTDEPDPSFMAIDELHRVTEAGEDLAEAAARVAREFDGVHRLRLALARWYQVRANEFGRGQRDDDQDLSEPSAEESGALVATLRAPSEDSRLISGTGSAKTPRGVLTPLDEPAKPLTPEAVRRIVDERLAADHRRMAEMQQHSAYQRSIHKCRADELEGGE